MKIVTIFLNSVSIINLRLINASIILRINLQLKWEGLYVNEIYNYNNGSRVLFEKNGFQAYKSTDRGFGYKLDLFECKKNLEEL